MQKYLCSSLHLSVDSLKLFLHSSAWTSLFTDAFELVGGCSPNMNSLLGRITDLRRRKQKEGNVENDQTFDSIESMNAEELLVKRKRGSKKYLIILAIICGAFLVLGILIGYFAHPDESPSASGAPVTDGDSFDYVKFILDTVDKDRIRETLKKYSSEPRLAGTDLGNELAATIEKDWKSMGLEEVHLASYNVLLSFPNTSNPNVIELINTTSGEVQTIDVNEGEEGNGTKTVPPYNAFSPAGDVTGDLVYVNYGRIEDFKYLTHNMSINITEKIVIIRYGKIFRGDKLRNAERFKALAVILYSDPSDFNMDNDVNNTYPHSWWLPPSGAQRGVVAVGDGDAQTPLYPSTDYAYRLPLKEVDLPTIPCQPVGYGEAQKLLSIMDGPEAPASWRGNLSLIYRVGPGFLNQTDRKVRVNVNNYVEVKPVHNVIGYIKGSEEPDRYVLLGNHHDAWVYGAIDPLSGSASLNEIAHTFGLMLKKGHRPRRTLVFCSWDGEESGLMGSVEWVEDHLKVLHQRAVAYLNMDYAAVGNYTFAVGTSPLLQDALYSVAKQIPAHDPEAGKTFYDVWKARPMEKTKSSTDPYVTYSLGSGSDMGAFYQRAGVPCVNMWMNFDVVKYSVLFYPLYHSRYETFFAYDNFIDPGFHATKAITQYLAVLAWELSNVDLLPFTVQRYSAALTGFNQKLIKAYGDRWQSQGVNVDAFTSAIGNFTAATKAYQDVLDADKKDITKSSLYVRRVNDQLMMLERAFLDPEGLPGRPSQKHVIFAPNQFDSYTDSSFPGITDTMYEIDQGEEKWEQLKQQIFIATYTIQSAADTLSDIGL